MAIMTTHLSRRRFIRISAAVAGLAVAPFATHATDTAVGLVEWRGTLLGAVATIKLHHRDRGEATRLITPAGAAVQSVLAGLGTRHAESHRRAGRSGTGAR
jgi:hypothetical protein